MANASPEPLRAAATERIRSNTRTSLGYDDPDHTLLRTRRALVFLTVMGLCTIPADIAVALYLEPARWQHLVGIRLFASLAMLAVAVYLFRRPTSGRALLRIERFTTPTLAALSSSMALVAGGVGSIYGITPIIVLLGRSAMRSDPWRMAAPSVALTLLTYPGILALGAVMSPRIAAGWTDPAALTTFSAYILSASALGGFTIYAGHTTYALKRQVYEARQIGRYKLRRLIGEGGMGEVWAAYFPALKREVAIKIMRTPGVDAISRFEREVRATAELTHPNTVRIFDYGQTDDGLWYYAMEKLEGESLAALLRREGALDPSRALHFLSQAARALAEAHARGIVHRDIKPENLFVADQGGERDFLKVLDFGIAKLSEAPASFETTGTIQGTPGYIAPELLRGARADPRADIYSLGAVGYAALAGLPPFSGATIAEILESTLHGTPAPPSERLGHPIPEDLEAVIMRCLEPDPEARFSSSEELAAALAACTGVGRWSPSLAPAEVVTSAESAEFAAAATVPVPSTQRDP
jgi:eukaryotic-like serine/threonine-protein kinase